MYNSLVVAFVFSAAAFLLAYATSKLWVRLNTGSRYIPGSLLATGVVTVIPLMLFCRYSEMLVSRADEASVGIIILGATFAGAIAGRLFPRKSTDKLTDKK